MKAFLLAAGNGTRLRPLTDRTPKCLLPIQGVPLLDIWLEICHRNGINEVLLNTHAHAATVYRHVRQHKRSGVRVELFEEPELLGSAGTVAANRGWVSCESCFWVLYADVLTNADLQPMLERHQAGCELATIGVYRVPDPKRCGIVQLDEESRVLEFVEKPAIPHGNLAFSGIFVAASQFAAQIPEGSKDLGHDVLPRFVGRMSAHLIDSYLLDIGTAENYSQAQATWPGLHESYATCSPL